MTSFRRSLPPPLRKPLPARPNGLRHNDLCPKHVQRLRPGRLYPERCSWVGDRVWRVGATFSGHVGVCGGEYVWSDGF
jgi:hypothetical protein